MGGGTDIAMESADIVLMNTSLETAVTAIQLSKAVMRTIKQNLFWALFYNSLCIPLAAGVFYTVFGLKLNPMFAAAAMSFSSVSVVVNALRLNSFRPKNTSDDTAAAVCKQNGLCTPHSTDNTGTQLNNTFEEEKDMNTTAIFTVEGMSCGHCSARIEQALNAIEGVSAQVDLKEKTVSITHPGTVTVEILKKTITEAGYTVTAYR